MPDQQAKRPTKIIRAKMAQFIQAYLSCGIISDACHSIVVQGQAMDRRTPGYWAKKYPEFAENLANAREEVNDQIEKEIYRRAVTGWDEPVYQGGKQVGVIRKYDSTMLIFLAKAHMPEKYRDKFEGVNLGLGPTFNMNFAGDGVIRAIAGLSPEELERLAERGKPIEGEFRKIEAPV